MAKNASWPNSPPSLFSFSFAVCKRSVWTILGKNRGEGGRRPPGRKRRRKTEKGQREKERGSLAVREELVKGEGVKAKTEFNSPTPIPLSPFLPKAIRPGEIKSFLSSCLVCPSRVGAVVSRGSAKQFLCERGSTRRRKERTGK